MPTLRILIADDHDLIRRGIRQLLAARPDWEIIHEACNGYEATELAAALLPDVAILDFSMPLMNGPAAARKIIERSPATSVLILTMHDSEQAMHEVHAAGALGLVLKSDADHILLEAVESVAAKRAYFTRHAAAVLHDAARRSQDTSLSRATEPRTLTEREREVVRLLADGLTSKQVADTLRISTRTVESHRLNINRKIGFNSIADLVRYAIRNNITTYAPPAF
jgi:DNA-binding NarL/FixJ family response regulator